MKKSGGEQLHRGFTAMGEDPLNKFLVPYTVEALLAQASEFVREQQEELQFLDSQIAQGPPSDKDFYQAALDHIAKTYRSDRQYWLKHEERASYFKADYHRKVDLMEQAWQAEQNLLLRVWLLEVRLFRGIWLAAKFADASADAGSFDRRIGGLGNGTNPTRTPNAGFIRDTLKGCRIKDFEKAAALKAAITPQVEQTQAAIGKLQLINDRTAEIKIPLRAAPYEWLPYLI